MANEGRELLPYVEKIYQDEEVLAEKISWLREVGGGVLSIGTFNSISFNYLPDILARFRELCPDVSVNLVHGSYSRIEQSLLEEQIQCGFVSIPTHESLTVWPLFKDRMLVILPEDHPLSCRAKLSPNDLSEERFIIPPEGLNYTVGSAFARAGLVIKSTAVVDEDYSALLLIKRGFGITVFPEGVFKTLPVDGIVGIPFGKEERTIGIAVKSSVRVSVQTRKFIRACRDIIGYKLE